MPLSMPDEVLLAIIAAARPTAAWLAGASTTCRRFASLCRDDSLWRMIAVDTLGQATVSALCTKSHKMLVRFVGTTRVHVNVVSLAASCRDGPVAARGAPYLQAERRLDSVATLDALSRAVCAIRMCPPHRSHVWVRQRGETKRHSPYRLIRAPLVSVVWASDRPWWATMFDRFRVDGTVQTRLAIDALGISNPSLIHDLCALLHVPRCVVNATSSDLGIPSPYTWYSVYDPNGASCFSLTHDDGCACPVE
ncbi:F-box domain containing protein [Pandoravirus salinus]|uniref:F-box domain containing protein n=1 Tax=Pandoravirus salinus TaxID=1349410 RepID=S4W1S7_9VIRU|nr:F-box domain [Pandoravirus salinus]AGO84387.1 F-box domain containing protein [Pandoravirus salinus]